MRSSEMANSHRTKREMGGTIYFVGEVSPETRAFSAVKIGHIGPEEKVAQRLATLQTGNPRELRLYASFEGLRTEEKFLHGFFRAFRVRNEWFLPESRLMSFIATCQSLHRLDLPGLAPCMWIADANGRRSRSLETCPRCDRCDRPETPAQKEVREELERRTKH